MDEARIAVMNGSRGRSFWKDSGDYMNKGGQEPSPCHIEPSTGYFKSKHQGVLLDSSSNRPDNHTSLSSQEIHTSSSCTESHGTEQICDIGGNESYARAEPSISRQDFDNGKSHSVLKFWLSLPTQDVGTGMDDPTDIPHGSRFRRESIQMATRILEKHSKAPRARFLDQNPVIETPPPMEVPLKEAPRLLYRKMTMISAQLRQTRQLAFWGSYSISTNFNAMTILMRWLMVKAHLAEAAACRTESLAIKGQSKLSGQLGTMRGLTRVPH